MLTAITTRKSTPHEDAEPWPAGSARPVLAYLTSTVGLTGGDAADLLTAARTAQAEGGPGTLVGYPIPGRDAHLLIHYAPGSSAYRLKLTSPHDEAPSEATAGPDHAPGNGPGPDEPSAGRATPDGGPPGDADGTPAPGLPGRRPRPQAQQRRRSRSPCGTTSPPAPTTGPLACWTATSPATPWVRVFT
jgi:hypothetical protein